MEAAMPALSAGTLSMMVLDETVSAAPIVKPNRARLATCSKPQRCTARDSSASPLTTAASPEQQHDRHQHAVEGGRPFTEFLDGIRQADQPDHDLQRTQPVPLLLSIPPVSAVYNTVISMTISSNALEITARISQRRGGIMGGAR